MLMALPTILIGITCISFFQLALISYFNPIKLNLVANNWFGLFSFSAGCMMLNVVIYKFGAESSYKQLIAFNELSRFVIAPALYLCVRHFTLPDKRFKILDYLHFIPFALFFVYISPFLIIKNYDLSGSTTIYLPILIKLRWPFLMSSILKLQLLCYWILSFYNLNQHQKNIKLIHATVKDVDLQWLKYLLYGLALMLFMWFGGSIFKARWIDSYSSVVYLGGVLTTGYYLLAQKEVYPFEQSELAEISQMIITENIKLETTRFSNERLTQYKNQLSDLMKSDKVYLNNELNLPHLAKAMDISTHDLSYVLNKGFGMSFFQLVNSYRVAEAKQLLLSDKHKYLNILGIAYSAGFNSKTTFNTAFKKETGLSPTEFIKTLNAPTSRVASAKS